MNVSRLAESLGEAIVPLLEEWDAIALAILGLIFGFFLLRITVRMLLRAVGRGLREQSKDLLRKAVMYIGTGVLLVIVLNAAGVSVGALLGAAGVLGIAIGIASQTSLSNIISGLFLVSERFFEIKDIVQVGDVVGVVHSIDLLSVKVRTFDNVLIRIPNQQLIEQNITNLTRFPVRRMDIRVTVPFEQELTSTLEALRRALRECLLVLGEPPPFLMVLDPTENGWKILVGAWFEHRDYVSVRNDMTAAIQRVFAEEGMRLVNQVIEISESARSHQL